MNLINNEFVDPISGDSLDGELAEALENVASEISQQSEAIACSLQDMAGDTAREIEENREHHAKAYAAYARRIENAQAHRRSELAEIEDEKRRIRQKYDADMHQLDVERKAIEAAALSEIATAKRLAAASKSALEALQS